MLVLSFQFKIFFQDSFSHKIALGLIWAPQLSLYDSWWPRPYVSCGQTWGILGITWLTLFKEELEFPLERLDLQTLRYNFLVAENLTLTVSTLISILFIFLIHQDNTSVRPFAPFLVFFLHFNLAKLHAAWNNLYQLFFLGFRNFLALRCWSLLGPR